MYAALNILFCFLVPCLFALGASYLSLSALRHHTTFRQLVFSAFVVMASVASVSVLFQDVFTGQAVSALPIALVSFCFIFSIGQFATAALLGAVGRLGQKMA